MESFNRRKFENVAPRRKRLSESLILRTVENTDDIERLARFSTGVFEEEVGLFTRRLLNDHPATDPRHWLLIEHDRDGIVSSLCLIPWRFSIGGIEMKAAEMGIVGTAPAYRKQGMVRKLVREYNELLVSEEFHLSHIQGIPYFYRQFGYEYSAPLIPDLRLDPGRITSATLELAAESRYTIRPARLDDAEVLTRLSDDAASTYDVRCLRDESIWNYLLSGPSSGEGETWCVCSSFSDRAEVEAYFRTHRQGFGKGLIVSESSLLDETQSRVVLTTLKSMCEERNLPHIKFEMHRKSPLAEAAARLGAEECGGYGWQIRLVDPQRMFSRLSGLFERRIAASAFAGLSANFVIDWYRDAFEIVFKDGAITDIRSPASDAGKRIKLPGASLAPLMLGYRSIDDLKSAYLFDVSVPDDIIEIVRILFPHLDAWIATMY